MTLSFAGESAGRKNGPSRTHAATARTLDGVTSCRRCAFACVGMDEKPMGDRTRTGRALWVLARRRVTGRILVLRRATLRVALRLVAAGVDQDDRGRDPLLQLPDVELPELLWRVDVLHGC